MDPEILIHRLVRRLQQRNRFVGRSSQSTFTLAEAHILVELDSAPGKSIGEVAQDLRVDQSFASRLVQGLAHRKLLMVIREPGDARRRSLSLSATGREAVREIDEQANLNYRAMLSRISREEEGRLVWLLKTISDGFGQPPLVVRCSETPYRVEQRRFTRCCGLLSDTVFGSKLSATAWQLLGEVVLSPVAPQPGELASLLSLAQNSLSSLVTKMESRKLIVRERDARDGRGIVLRPLPAGERVYREVEDHAAETIGKALANAQPEAIENSVRVFQRFLGDMCDGIAPLSESYSVNRADSPEERSSARGFMARSLVRESWEQSITENFVSSQRECLIMRSRDSILAALEIDLSSQAIVNCGWHESVSPWVLLSFVGHAAMLYPELQRSLLSLSESCQPLRAYLACRNVPIAANR